MDDNDFYSRLKDEIVDWQRDGVVDSSQAEAIMQRYGIEKKGYKPGNVITAISTLASILVGVGIILFFASNWEKIPAFVKISLLLITTFSTYYAGYVMRFEKKNYPRVGHALLFLASLFVGAAIFLIGQIFHISVDSHWLVLLWFISISPMGYVFESRPTIGLNIMVFALWIWLLNITGVYRDASTILLLYLLFGIALYSIGQIHEITDKWSRFRMVYKSFGVFFILASYFYFSIWPSNHLYRYSYYSQQVELATAIQLLMGVFALLAVVSILVNLFEKDRLKTTRYEFYVLLSAFVGWILLFTINMYPILNYNKAVETLLFIIFNLFLFGISIGTISIGYYKNEANFVNIGIPFFALGVMQVYVTHLQRMLPKGLGLIIGGIVLFIIATYLEKKRRYLLTDIREKRK